MLDQVITGGTVVTPAGAGQWDIGIQGERIVAVALPGFLPAEGATVIDAAGKIVVPGGIESHAHAAANVQPGARQLVAGTPNAGPLDHSLGAIWGGTTTVMDFAPGAQPGRPGRRHPRLSSPSGGVTPTPTTPPTASTPAAALPTPSPATASSSTPGSPASRCSPPTSGPRKAGCTA